MLYVLITISILVIIKSIFSAADTAFTYINRAEIKQLSKTDKKAEKIRILMEDSNKFFGIIEVGINMCELLAGAVVSVTVLEYVIDALKTYGLSINTTIVLGVIIVTAILSYIMLVFGGVLPKRIARNHPKKVAYNLIDILWIVAKLNRPFEWLIDTSTNIFSKIMGIKVNDKERMTEKQLKLIIKEAKDEGVLENIEKKIFFNTIKANDIEVRKAMIPLNKLFLINIDDDFDDIIENIQENKYTRIPAYEDETTNIIGTFNVKEAAIKYVKGGLKNKEQIQELLKEPTHIKQDEKIFKVFKELQKNNKVMGIVYNNENIPIGLISIEDILEKLVGKIFDEDDKRD